MLDLEAATEEFTDWLSQREGVIDPAEAARAVIEAALGDTVLYREVVTMENHGSLPGVTASIPRTEYIRVWPEATKEKP